MSSKVQPPLRYPGSKFRAYKYIEPFIKETPHTEYREAFLGSGAVFFQKELSKNNWINDLDPDLINFYKVIQNKELASKLASEVVNVVPSKAYFEELKASKPKNDYEKAFRYFVLNRTAYSGIMHLPNWGFHPIKSVQPDKWPQRILSASEKLQNIKITSLSYEDVIFSPSQNKVLIFLDPPYYAADQKRAYEKSFEVEDHIKLAENLKKLNFDFILTYDNCPEILELYSWANIHRVEFMYHTANSCVTTRKMGKELIITNMKNFPAPHIEETVSNKSEQLSLFDNL